MAIKINTTLEPTRTATWDKIGTDISAAKTIDEALAKARLDFTVEKKPLFTPVSDVMTDMDVMTDISGWCSTVGTDGKIRGVVHDSYEVINNSDAFSLAEALHDEGNLSFVKGGETYKGMSYLIMALPEFEVLGDGVKLYFILQNSFAGQQALKAAIVPLRIVCQNQFRLAFRDADNTINIRHTRTALDRLEAAREMLGFAGEYITCFQKYATQLAGTKVTKAQINQFIDAMFPQRADASSISIQRNNVLKADFLKCYKANDLANFNGTAWGLLNAWQDFETHSVGFKQKAQAADYKFMQLANSGSNKASEVLGKIIKIAA